MSSSIDKVIDIFLKADVHVVPRYNEVRDEFEILDFESCVTDDMIFQVQMHIAKHLDTKFSSLISKECNHVNGLAIHWMSRKNIGPN